MKLRDRIVNGFITFANGAINYILVTLCGFLIYVIIPCAIVFPVYALFNGHYAFALIIGALDFITFFCVRAIGRKRAKKAQAEKVEQFAKQKATREQQIEEIALFMHELRRDYADGKISDDEFDRQLDFINCLESEAGISMDESMEIDYESIYHATKSKSQPQNATHRGLLTASKHCKEQAISDYAQGKISAKEFADICALLRKVENEPSISTQETDKNSQQAPAEEIYPIENDNELRTQTQANRFVAHNTADLDMLHISPDIYAQAVREKLNLDPYDPEYHKGARNPYTNAIVTCEDDYIEYVKSFVLERLTAEKRTMDHSELNQKPQKNSPTSVEKPIGYIPNSSYVPIPWWRSTKVLVRLALVLMALALPISIIWAIVSSVSEQPSPTANTALSPVVKALPSLPAPTESLSIQERLDRLGQAGNPAGSSIPSADPLPQPVPIPRSGRILYENPYFNERVAPLTIDASNQPVSSYYYVKLRFAQVKTPILAFFIRGGTKETIDVPLGTYELLYASGTEWYGQDLLFGPNTSYYLADELFKFYEENDYVNGWTVTLSKQYNGNLDIDEISADEFG